LSRLLPEPLPKKIRIVLADLIYVEKLGLSLPHVNTFIHMAAFQNPEFYKAQAMRMPTYNKPRVIDCSEEMPRYIALPRGCQEEVVTNFEFPIVLLLHCFEKTPIESLQHRRRLIFTFSIGCVHGLA